MALKPGELSADHRATVGRVPVDDFLLSPDRRQTVAQLLSLISHAPYFLISFMFNLF